MTRRRVPDDAMLRQRFGRLTVIWEAPPAIISGASRRRWVCRCDCGTVVDAIHQTSLRAEGGTRSCGCLAREVASKRMWGENVTGDDILAAEAAQRAIEARQWEQYLERRAAGAEGGGGPVLPPGIPADALERADDAGSARCGRVAVPCRAPEVHESRGSAGD